MRERRGSIPEERKSQDSSGVSSTDCADHAILSAANSVSLAGRLFVMDFSYLATVPRNYGRSIYRRVLTIPKGSHPFNSVPEFITELVELILS